MLSRPSVRLYEDYQKYIIYIYIIIYINVLVQPPNGVIIKHLESREAMRWLVSPHISIMVWLQNMSLLSCLASPCQLAFHAWSNNLGTILYTNILIVLLIRLLIEDTTLSFIYLKFTILKKKSKQIRVGLKLHLFTFCSIT